MAPRWYYRENRERAYEDVKKIGHRKKKKVYINTPEDCKVKLNESGKLILLCDGIEWIWNKGKNEFKMNFPQKK